MEGEEGDPIFEAAFSGHVEEVARLLDAEPHLMEAREDEGVWGDNRRTLLMVAGARGRVGVVRLLLERGAEVNAANYYGMTALHYAADEGRDGAVSALLNGGADSSMANLGGYTALILSSFNGHLNMTRELLQFMQGRGLDLRDADGWTALWGACHNGHVEIARILLFAEADPTIASNDGRTPRQAAEQQEHTECVALLEWWEGELERAYVLHRARCLSELSELSATSQAPAIVSSPHYLTARGGPPPTVEVVSLAQGSGEDIGTGAKEEEADGGEAIGEEEKGATLTYVTQDLAHELFIELLEGFHK